MEIMEKEKQKLEKKILAYLFHDKKFIAIASGKINDSMFTKSNQLIYSLLIKYYGKYHDIITDEAVNIAFTKRKIEQDVIVNYRSVITEVRAIPIKNDGEFEYLLDELRDFKKRKEYAELAQNILIKNPASCSTIELEKLELETKQRLVSLSNQDSNVRKEGLLRDSVDDILKRYEDVRDNPQLLKFTKTGFKHIDDTMGGFLPGELVYVIGRKGDGKSVLMLNLAHNAWLIGKNVLLFTLEISKEDYERRFTSRTCEIPSDGLKKGTLTELEYVTLKKYNQNIKINKGLNGENIGQIYFVDCPAGCTPAFIDGKIEVLEQTKGIKFDVIITDYAGIMKPNISVEQKRHEQGQIALDLKRIARTRECVVISAAQMSRAGKSEAKSSGDVGTEHVAESDQISDHIDCGIAIMTDEKDKNRGIISSFKTRDSGDFKFRYNKKFHIMKVEELQDGLEVWDNLNGLLDE